ncbi:hypothetical protein E6H23_07585 [Candidatus Bathyarchaeota archaeon]|nr:MAG: hypothetical protein E6H23_07585 [Candidatus Bathyarchaeota archaeon]
MNRHFDKEFFVFAIFLFAATGIFWYYMSLPLCACPLINNGGGKEAFIMESASFVSGTNVTLYLRDTGSAPVNFQTYFVKDSMGDQWRLDNWNPPGQPIAPNDLLIVNIAIGSGAGGCGNGCQYTGTPGAFTTFQFRQTYTVIVLTARNTQFTFTVIR